MEDDACKQGAFYRGLWIPLGTLLPGGCKAPAPRNENNGLTCPSPSSPPYHLRLPPGGHVILFTAPLVRWPCGSGTRALRWRSPQTVTWL